MVADLFHKCFCYFTCISSGLSFHWCRGRKLLTFQYDRRLALSCRIETYAICLCFLQLLVRLVGREDAEYNRASGNFSYGSSGVSCHHGHVERIGADSDHQSACTHLDGVGRDLIGSYLFIARHCAWRGNRDCGGNRSCFFYLFSFFFTTDYHNFRSGHYCRLFRSGFCCCGFLRFLAQCFCCLFKKVIGKVYRLPAPFGKTTYQFGFGFIQCKFIGDPFFGCIFFFFTISVADFSISIVHFCGWQLTVI